MIFGIISDEFDESQRELPQSRTVVESQRWRVGLSVSSGRCRGLVGAVRGARWIVSANRRVETRRPDSRCVASIRVRTGRRAEGRAEDHRANHGKSPAQSPLPIRPSARDPPQNHGRGPPAPSQMKSNRRS